MCNFVYAYKNCVENEFKLNTLIAAFVYVWLIILFW